MRLRRASASRPSAIISTAPGTLNSANRAYIQVPAAPKTARKIGRPSSVTAAASAGRGLSPFFRPRKKGTVPTTIRANPGHAAQAYHEPPSWTRACHPSAPRTSGSSPRAAVYMPRWARISGITGAYSARVISAARATASPPRTAGPTLRSRTARPPSHAAWPMGTNAVRGCAQIPAAHSTA